MYNNKQQHEQGFQFFLENHFWKNQNTNCQHKFSTFLIKKKIQLKLKNLMNLY